MSRYFILISLITAYQFSFAQLDTSYKRQWLEIDSLYRQKALPQSALAKVNTLYSQAQKENKHAQVIKALLYRRILEQRLKAASINDEVKDLQQEIQKANTEEVKAILNNILVEKYATYFQNNRWRLYNRSKTVDFKKEDIETWGADDFHKAITATYKTSLQPSELLISLSIYKYEAILNLHSTNYYRPTLYDLLAHEALTYYKSDETYITQAADHFIIKQPEALSNISSFINFKFTTGDSISNKWKALLLYQDLLRFHQKQKDTAALIDVNLDRIQYVKNHGIFANKDSLYKAALLQTAQAYNSSRFAADAWHLLAQQYVESAQTYRAQGDTSKRFDYIKALEITQRFVPLKDSTKGHYGMYNLHQTIFTTALQTKTEQVVAPALPIKALVEYRNVNELYYRVIAATKAVEDLLKSLSNNYNRKRNFTIFSIAKNFAYLRQEKILLPATGDHQPHSVEIKIDALPIGKYYILASSSAGFYDSARLSFQQLIVSNISYTNNGAHYFVLNRTTGQPLTDAKVVSKESYWNNASRRNQTNQNNYRTNANGYFKIQESKEYSKNISLDITHKNDRLHLDEQQYLQATNNNVDEDSDDEDYEEDNAKPFFFLDRSIYRPGQTVYFKILVLTKDRTTKQPKIYHINSKDSGYLFLKNVNGEEIDSISFVLNEYGSFAGKFVLPANTLTGEFSLEMEGPNEDFTHTFSVEEYKRPTFSVEIKKPEGTYKLQQKIAAVLQAQAYAGNATDGAIIKYTVTRSGRFLYPWRWNRGYSPRSSSTLITTGEAVTDAEGKYTVQFDALPDEAINKDQMPVFDFKIDADVTDRSGETRSASATISIGYHLLNLKVTMPENAEADSLKNIFVSTTNLAGDKQPANVQVKIHSLISPEIPIKKSYWQQPDQFIYTREEFKKYFPNEEYKNENDKTIWKKGAALFTTFINTKDSGRISIPKGTLKAGWYLVEATTTDKEGNEIKDVKYVQIFSTQAGQFNSNNYIFTSLINNSVTAGQSANFLIGTPASNVFLIQHIERKPTNKNAESESEFLFHSVDKNVKRIKVLPRDTDKNSIGVSFVFIKDNRCYTWQQTVFIQQKENTLDVEVITYRNKLEPGSNETWTVKVKGPDKEAAAAEVLTSMYDASLNQFKPHQWSVPQLSSFQPGYGGFNSSLSFRDQFAYQNWLPTSSINRYFIYPAIDFRMQDAPQKSYLLNSRNNTRLPDFNGGRNADMGRADNFSPMHTSTESALQGKALGVSSNMEEVVVTGYGAAKRSMSTSAVTIRGTSSLSGNNGALVVVDGIVVGSTSDVNPDDIASAEVLKDAAATALYGARGANGVIIITTKNAQKPGDLPVQVRTNFNETAFFFPQLYTDVEGNLSFSFKLPDALTQWNWQILAHDKKGNIGISQKTIVSQKTLMVQMNAPRFLREGDKITLSAKISNLSTDALAGKATLQLLDAITGIAVDAAFAKDLKPKNFTVNAAQSTSVNFDIAVPVGFTNPVTWKVIASAATFSDGEENTIPILSNRMLVTESFTLFTRGDGTKNFQFNNLLKSNSTTLQHQSVTVEYTSNPIWNVIQALPYLMEYPHECAEQIFNRVYANALAATTVKNHPRIQQVFKEWMKDSTALLSNLEKNQELKSILLQETPWVMQAKSEAQQKKDISMLFQVMKLAAEMKKNIEKLKQMQMANGAFPWFKGGQEDRHMTQYILTGIGRLQKMNAIPKDLADEFASITQSALRFLNKEIDKDFNELKNSKADLKANHLGPMQLQYLFMRAYFPDETIKKTTAYQFYYKQAKAFWVQQSSYFKAMTGAVLLQDDQPFVINTILPSLLENGIMDKDSAMYWKDNVRGFYWYQAPVEQQVIMMELVHDVYVKTSQKMYADRLNDMKTWLLKQKQTNHWNTTKATADACYVLVSTGTNALADNRNVKIVLGDVTMQSPAATKEAGTGYFKQTIAGNNVQTAMGNISITTTSEKHEKLPSYGAVYWQYFEQLDKIPAAKETPFTIVKKLFKELKTGNGPVLQPVNNGEELNPGDKIIVRIEMKTDRSMEYIHLKDMRAAGTEPVNVISRYKWQDGLGYYESTRDASTNFFISYMPVGTYVFEYPIFVTHAGNFSVGIATAQCMYAPEFSSHSEGINVRVKRSE